MVSLEVNPDRQYPKGAAQIVFENREAYVGAIRFIRINTIDQEKKVVRFIGWFRFFIYFLIFYFNFNFYFLFSNFFYFLIGSIFIKGISSKLQKMAKFSWIFPNYSMNMNIEFFQWKMKPFLLNISLCEECHMSFTRYFCAQLPCLVYLCHLRWLMIYRNLHHHKPVLKIQYKINAMQSAKQSSMHVSYFMAVASTVARITFVKQQSS